MGHSTTRDMSDKHEADLQKWMGDGALVTRGSGNQARSPMDVRQSRHHVPWAFALDGKSTKAASMSFRLEDWFKAEEQAHGEHPGMPVRFYTPRLQVVKDLILVDLHDFIEMRGEAIRAR